MNLVLDEGSEGATGWYFTKFCRIGADLRVIEAPPTTYVMFNIKGSMTSSIILACLRVSPWLQWDSDSCQLFSWGMMKTFSLLNIGFWWPLIFNLFHLACLVVCIEAFFTIFNTLDLNKQNEIGGCLDLVEQSFTPFADSLFPHCLLKTVSHISFSILRHTLTVYWTSHAFCSELALHGLLNTAQSYLVDSLMISTETTTTKT